MNNNELLCIIKKDIEFSICKLHDQLLFKTDLIQLLKADLERINNYVPDQDEKKEEYLIVSSFQLHLRNKLIVGYVSNIHPENPDYKSSDLKETYKELNANGKRLECIISDLKKTNPEFDTTEGYKLCKSYF
jgi:hypothetical protein